jgi:hypothetical protein
MVGSLARARLEEGGGVEAYFCGDNMLLDGKCTAICNCTRM